MEELLKFLDVPLLFQIYLPFSTYSARDNAFEFSSGHCPGVILIVYEFLNVKNKQPVAQIPSTFVRVVQLFCYNVHNSIQ